MERDKRQIAYIVSMPHGMDKWAYDEIDELCRNDLQVLIFPLRCTPGPYMPKPDWYCHRLRKRNLAAGALYWSLRAPRRTMRLAVDALRTQTLVDCLIAFEFARTMKRLGVELVHAIFGDHKLFVAYYCTRLLGVPLSAALYGYDLHYNPNWTMFRRAIRACDNVVVNCDFNKALLERIMHLDGTSAVHVIRHSADIVPDPPTRPVKLLMVGRFEERKGHALLFQALRLLDDRAAALEVWIAGMPGPVDVEGLVHSEGLEKVVKVLGTVSDETLALLFRECDIFCLPSRTDRFGVSEGLPVALIEAMAHGKPVITSRIAGVPELVEDILIEEDDVSGLARAICTLAEAPALRQQMGARNRNIVLERYSRRNLLATRDVLLCTLQAVREQGS